MSTFPSIQASFGVQKNSQPTINEIKYGDGYSSRITFGLNQNKKKYNLSWRNITETESNTIEDFLDARAKDVTSFTYTPPQESSSSQYICKQWSKTINYAGRATIQATFEEVFQP
ncbi:MAG: hypothetical protein CMA63_03300 [Euryarchaeota archaeon]|nr:hypothetical protein [Euryarchaeota archaeon]|tara:strand:- start:7325 stop:7669 length:345 start_codon:yes stop_codon:yes gene_type:complete